jgi:hypothetical protein
MSEQSPDLRDTNYATEIGRAVLPLSDGNEARIERLIIKSSGQVEIRLSWWKDERMMMRPLDLPESDLMTLLVRGIREGVLSPERQAG